MAERNRGEVDNPNPLVQVREIEGVTSPFQIYKGDDFWNNVDSYCPGNEKIKQSKDALINAGFTKFTCPFSILIGGTDKFPDGNMLYTANVLAYLLDPNADGGASKNEVQKKLFDYWINCGELESVENRGNGIMSGN